MEPELIIASGDLTHRGRREQHDRAAAFLKSFELPVLAVPGNHDIPHTFPARFTRPFREFERQWQTAEPVHRSDALFIVASVILSTEHERIIRLAAKHRLPAIYDWREHAQSGGLMAYGGSVPGFTRRAAVYVDRIFKGASPADLPVERATTFELAINLKTAKALGLTIPQTLLLQADRVIE